MFDLHKPDLLLIEDHNVLMNDQSAEEYQECIIQLLEQTIQQISKRKSMNEHELFIRGQQQSLESFLMYVRELGI